VTKHGGDLAAWPFATLLGTYLAVTAAAGLRAFVIVRCAAASCTVLYNSFPSSECRVSVVIRDVPNIRFMFIFGRIVATIEMFVFMYKYAYFEYEYLEISHLQYLQNLNQKSPVIVVFVVKL